MKRSIEDTPPSHGHSSSPHKQVAGSLLGHGYVVIRIMDNNQTATARCALEKDIATYKDVLPTYKDIPKEKRPPLVLGSFGALGNAASSHSPAVRKLRDVVHTMGFPCMAATAQVIYDLNGKEFKVAQVPDRPRVQPDGATTSQETWHRDISPFNRNGQVFGGWVNLDPTPQYFSCVPGSHYDPLFVARKGFSKEKHIESTTGVGARLVNGRPVQKVVVPQGCMLIFDERILHEICKSKTKNVSMRLHTAWYLTEGDTPLIPDMDKILEDQKPMTVKSGQHPPVYAQLHLVNWPEKLKSLKEVYNVPFIPHTYKTGTKKGTTVMIPHALHKPMPSLRELSIHHGCNMMYPEYTKDEISHYYPQSVIQKDGEVKKRKV